MTDADELLYSLFSTLTLTIINHVEYADANELIRICPDFGDSKVGT